MQSLLSFKKYHTRAHKKQGKFSNLLKVCKILKCEKKNQGALKVIQNDSSN